INVTIAIAIGALPQFARIVRGSTLTTKKLEYVDAVRALGARDGKIIFQHILPNIMSPIIVNTTIFIATAILSAAGLSFLGLGVQPPTPEWGAMLNGGRNYMYQAAHITFFPGIMIVIVVLAFNLFGDGLRDALDPKAKKQEEEIMTQFIIRRLLQLIPVLLGVTILVFSLMHLTPGNPAVIMAGESAPEATVKAIEARLGLNDPLYEQYFRFLGNVVQLDFGSSIRDNIPVFDHIKARFAITLELSVISMIFSIFWGLLVGIIS